MAVWLPMKYNLLLFLVVSLLYPVSGLFFGEIFTDPNVTNMIILPLLIIAFANIGHLVKSKRGESGVVDERDAENIDFAFAVTGGVLPASIIALYIVYSLTDNVVPSEVDYLGLISVIIIFVVMMGVEIYQRV